MPTPLDMLVRRQGPLLRPPPPWRLSAWADKHMVLSRESSATAGAWSTIPYQAGVLDACLDPKVERVVWLKSSRIGATKCLNILIAYHIVEDPAPILFYLPTIDEARRYSRKEIGPMLRDVPCLAGKVSEARAKDADNTILDKSFPGGSLELCGANSPTGFRARTARICLFDEVDSMPPSAGVEGDQIKLGTMRTQNFWNRKIVAISTPTMADGSRIESLFLEGTQEYFYVPCPVCGHFDTLEWQREEEGVGHEFIWPEGRPDLAGFVCSGCGVLITHDQKKDMVAKGEWRATAASTGTRSFFTWSAYSPAINASWAQIATEYEAAKKEGEEALKAFFNTVLGKTWKVTGEAPEWERLYRRREKYEAGTVPDGVAMLTCGVDVQADRAVYEVVGWGAGKESWSIEAGAIPGATSTEDSPVWTGLTDLLNRQWPGADGTLWHIKRLAIDSGFNTSTVYAWAHRDPARVIATKGMGAEKAIARTLLGTPSSTVLKPSGKTARRGLVWPIGVGLAKAELYSWLKLEPPLDPGGRYPAGFCHFNEANDEAYFKELCSEVLVTRRKRNGFTVEEWQIKVGRANHMLDCRVMARAAAQKERVDLIVPRNRPPRPVSVPTTQQSQPSAIAPAMPATVAPPVRPQRPTRDSFSRPESPRGKPSWIGRGKGPWVGRR